jgi:pyridoxine 5-phosphate synthase
MVELGVNIDHVATLRQARRGHEPDPIWAAAAAEIGGADCITIHLREDRRHIQDRDVELLRQTVRVKLNLELSCNPGVLAIGCRLRPEQATLVPERREEVTTEGGLDITVDPGRVREAVDRLRQVGVEVSLFLDPEPKQIEMAAKMAVEAVELHTGCYATATGAHRVTELARLIDAGKRIGDLGMKLHAGHGLNYVNVGPIASIEGMRELNIGHAIVSRAVFVGMQEATREMKAVIRHAVTMSRKP